MHGANYQLSSHVLWTPRTITALPLVLWVELADLLEYFSHFCNVSPYCHKLQNLQVLIRRALLNNMESLKIFFFLVCFKKFCEKLWSFRIRGGFSLLNVSVSSVNERKQYSKYTQCLLQREGMGVLVKMSVSYNRNCSRFWRTRLLTPYVGLCATDSEQSLQLCSLQWEGVAAFQQIQSGLLRAAVLGSTALGLNLQWENPWSLPASFGLYPCLHLLFLLKWRMVN